MRVLVTGGAGFIGSHVVDKLVNAGHEPRIFDLVASQYHSAGEIDSVTADLDDDEAVRRAVQGCDAIMHLAAMADVNEVLSDPARAERVNVRGTHGLLEAIRAEETGRFLYASTVWVYGNAADKEPIGEDMPLSLPPHFYTATKLAGEMYCSSYQALYGVASTILRFGIPYGPRARPAAVIPAFIAKARAGTPITIAGDGSQSRQFVYVEDLAEGMVGALAPVASGRVYNLVGDESVSVRHIADTVRQLVADVPIEYGPERPADLRIGRVCGARAKKDFGWQARTSFSEGVRRYVAWLDSEGGGDNVSPLPTPGEAQRQPPAVTSGSPAA